MPISRVNWKSLLIFVGLILVYFISGKLGLKLAFVHVSATAVWPPTAIALVSFLVLGPKFWPAIWIGAYLVNLTTAGSIATSVGIATGNTLEGIVGAYLVQRFANGKNALNRVSDIWRFIVLAGILATSVSATFGVTSLVLGGFAAVSDFSAIWLTWWLGDLSANFIIAPFLLLWLSPNSLNLKFEQILELIFYNLGVILLSLIIFIGFNNYNHYPMEFLIIPFMVLISYKFGHLHSSATTILVAAVAIWSTLHGLGPFSNWKTNESLLLLQTFISVVSITGLIVGATTTEQKRLDAAKLEFIWTSAHNLRDPLAKMRWGLEEILSKKSPNKMPKDLRNKLNSLYKNTIQIINLVNSLLKFGKDLFPDKYRKS